jgi:hypothetical protein
MALESFHGDPHRLLGLMPNATDKQIRKAYLKRLLPLIPMLALPFLPPSGSCEEALTLETYLSKFGYQKRIRRMLGGL